MMPTMEPEMMFGMETSLLLWIALAILVFLLVAGTCVRLMLSLRKKQRLAPGWSRSRPQDAFPAYERGYEAEQPAAAISQEAEQGYSFSEPYEQPQAQYPQTVSAER